MLTRLFIAYLLLIMPVLTHASEDGSLRIAVAANFADTLKKIADEFLKSDGIKIEIISGSTGKLYEQINEGAPYDVFVSADTEHIKMLIKADRAIADTRTDYAVGRLALWTPGKPAAKEGIKILPALRQISIANPEFAPYGHAAKEALEHTELWDKTSQKLVYGESIGQAMQFVASGAADGGFVALSQIINMKSSANMHNPETSDYWVVPANYHSPLLQSAVVIAATKHKDKAENFLDFLHSAIAKGLIEKSGYTLPEELAP